MFPPSHPNLNGQSLTFHKRNASGSRLEESCDRRSRVAEEGRTSDIVTGPLKSEYHSATSGSMSANEADFSSQAID
jgi:hypothetical protein